MLLSGRTTHMVEEGGPDVVKVSKEGEEAAPQLVIPHLDKKGNIYSAYS